MLVSCNKPDSFFLEIILFIYIFRCTGFSSLRGLSLVAASGDYSSRGTQAYLLRSTWGLPGPGLELSSPPHWQVDL